MADTTIDASDHERLRMLSASYAAGLDRRDTEHFLRTFHGDATLAVVEAGSASEASILRGHDELARVIDRIKQFDRTFHLVGQSTFDMVGDGVATGEVYCIAHHWRANEERAEQVVMYIRYRDEYRIGSDGEWRIAARTVYIDETETRDRGRT